MKFTTLTVKVDGPLWFVQAFTIETVDVKEKWEEDDDGVGSVTIKNFPVSPDNILDVFIHLKAPNKTRYEISMEGKIKNADDTTTKIAYSEKFKVERNGDLKIPITEKIKDLIED